LLAASTHSCSCRGRLQFSQSDRQLSGHATRFCSTEHTSC
jgi:hypothetical protein